MRPVKPKKNRHYLEEEVLRLLQDEDGALFDWL